VHACLQQGPAGSGSTGKTEYWSLGQGIIAEDGNGIWTEKTGPENGIFTLYLPYLPYF